MVNDTFYEVAFEEWAHHCRLPSVQISSSAGPVVQCEAYERLKAAGKGALPFIRRFYDSVPTDVGIAVVQSHGLVHLVGEILSDEFKVPAELAGKMDDINTYTKRWLDDYLTGR